ncbi:alpha/beta hydrolase family protein [Agromyces ramosus]|uniref:Alpha/beta hydrolase family protein n=1 Tax=Agromyces ramosus TaxID=33879 RepID=A0A4Q7MES6_9MICO|nr:alpha/beta hydrolase [Agromyces ramosus]RZS66511.1 alpha/beta hydrolase family protein [Agromyces ramosus]
MPRARVVLVHGLRTSATMWRRQLAALARHDVDATAVDLPGHGTRMDEAFTLDAAMEVIDAALAAAADGPRVPRLLVGLSLGGYLAIEYAATHRGRLDGLVAASCGTRPRGAGLAGYRRLAAAIGRLPDRGRALNDLMVQAFLSEEGVDDVLAGGVALDVMAPALEAVGSLDPEAALRRIDLPVWFVNGRFDHFRFEERRMLRAAHEGRLVVVPGATHLVSLARPDDFTAVVLGVAAELEARAARDRRRQPVAPPG